MDKIIELFNEYMDTLGRAGDWQLTTYDEDQSYLYAFFNPDTNERIKMSEWCSEGFGFGVFFMEKLIKEND